MPSDVGSIALNIYYILRLRLCLTMAGSYRGDYHTRNKDDIPESDWESTPRACNNCGKVTINVKRDRISDLAMPGR
jgi:hypothetical protein